MKSALASLALLLLVSCNATKTEPASPQTSFSSYEEATAYIRSHYNGETVRPTSKRIHKLEYYPAKGRGYMLIYFNSDQSKGYLFEGVPLSVWQEFKEAPSKGKFYQSRIGKGRENRYPFRLRS